MGHNQGVRLVLAAPNEPILLGPVLLETRGVFSFFFSHLFLLVGG